MVTESDVTKKLLTDKKVTAGEGDEAYQFGTKPEDILDYVTSDGKFWTMFKDTEGNLDLNKLIKTVNYALNMQAYEQGLIDHGKSLGTEVEQNDIHQIPKQEVVKAGETKESLNEAFQKRGRDIKR
jgi:hypothetical protein